MSQEITIIGLGNPLRGDDGVGVAVIEALGREKLAPSVKLVNAGQAGLGLVGILDTAERAVIVDCAEMGLPPGSVRTFGEDDIRVEAWSESVHNARAGTALEIARALGSLPSGTRIVGVQPGQMSWGLGLSSEISRAVPKAVKAVLDVLSQSVEGE